MNINLDKIREDLIDLCEDNDVMKESINEYFGELEEDSYFELVMKNVE